MPVVGSAEIIVVALTSGFKQQIKQAFREARPEAAKEGERYGKAFGDKFRIQLKSSMRTAFSENRDWIKQEGSRQGKLFGTEFTKSFATSTRLDIASALGSSTGDIDALGESLGKRLGDAVRRGASLESIIGGAPPAEPSGPGPGLSDKAAQRAADAAQKRLDAQEDFLQKEEQSAFRSAAALAAQKDAFDQKQAQSALKRIQDLAHAQDAADQKRAQAVLAHNQRIAQLQAAFSLKEQQAAITRARVLAQRQADEAAKAAQALANERIKAEKKAQKLIDDAFDAAIKEDRKRHADAAKEAAAKKEADEVLAAKRIAGLSSRERLKLAQENYAKLEALAKKHGDYLYDIQRKAVRAGTELIARAENREDLAQIRMEEAKKDRESAHLAQMLKASELEEDASQRVSDFAEERQRQAQADLDTTTAKVRAAAKAMSKAQLEKGGAREGRRQMLEAERDLRGAQALYAMQALQDEFAKREQLRRENEYQLALERVKDRELALERARQQKKSTLAAKAALDDAQREALASARLADKAKEDSKLLSNITFESEKEMQEARQRLLEADAAPGARINALTISTAEKAHARLTQLRDEAERDREAANAKRLADYEALTSAEIELARRHDLYIKASGAARHQAALDHFRQEQAVADAARRAGESDIGADRAKVRHEEVIIDVDRSQLQLDLFEREGRKAGLSFMRGLTPEFKQSAIAAQKAWSHLFRLGQAIGPGIAIAVQGIASLGAGLVSLSAVAAQAAGALVVLPGIIGALGGAAVTAAIAMKGVGEAIGAGFKAADEAASEGGGATLAQARVLEDARQSLSRAYENGARRMRDANRAVVDAEEDLAEAQNEARIAQNALTGARERAMETLEDLQFSLEGAVLSEEEAVLRLQRATEALAEVRTNPAATAQELQEASLNYREAELALRMAQDALEDVQEAQAAAAAAGVEGSEEVVGAQNTIIDANNRVADAQEALARAEEGRADDAVDNARAIADAQERVTEALENIANGSDSARSAAEAYQAKLAELSPGARGFVEYVVSLKDEFKTLREAAGENLFGPLTAGVDNVVQNFFPAFEEALRITGGAIGDFATSITDVIASSGFVARFTQIAEDNTDTIRRFGEIIASVIDGISGVLVAAGPLIDRFTSFLSSKAKDFQDFATSGEGIEKMAGFFERAGDTAAKFGEIAGNVFSSLMGVFSAAEPAGQTMLDNFIEMSANFEAFTQTAAGHTELQDYFTKAGETAKEVTGLLWDIVKAFAGMADESGAGEAAKVLRAEWVPVLEDILEALAGAGGALAEVVVEVTKIARAFADTGSIQTFLGILRDVGRTIADFVQSGIGEFFINLAGPLVAAASALGLVISGFQLVASVAVGGFLALSGVVTTIAGAVSAIISLLGTLGASAATIFVYETSMVGATATTAAWTVVTTLASAAIRNLGLALTSLLTNPITWVVAALGAAVGVFMAWRNAQNQAEAETKAFNDTLDEQTGLVTADTIQTYIDTLTDGASAMQKARLNSAEFIAVLGGGEAEIEAYTASLEASGMSTATVEKLTNEAREAQIDFSNKVEEGQQAIEAKTAAEALLTAQLEDEKEAQQNLTFAQMDANDQTVAAIKLQEDLRGEYNKAVDAFSAINKVGANTERTNIRVAAGYDELKGNIRQSITAIEDQKDAVKGFTPEQEKALKVNEAGIKILDYSTEAGRDAASAILDQAEAINERYKAELESAAVSEDSKAGIEAATQSFNDNMAALKEAATQAGVTDAAYTTFIDKIKTPVEEQEIHIKAIFEEQRVLALTEDLSARLLARVSLVLADTGDNSPEGIARAIGTALKNNPELVADIDVKTKQDVVDQAIADIKRVTTDEHGNPLKATILTGADKDTYDDSVEVLNLLKYDVDGQPREVVYMSVEDQQKRETILARLAEIQRPGGKTREVPVELQAETAQLEADLAELEANGATIPTTLKATVDPWATVNGKETWVGYGWVKYSAEGGAVTGPGGPTADKVGPFMLSSGEYILSAKSVQALGGTPAVDAMHKALKRGVRPPAMAAGGTMMPRAGGSLALLAEGGRAERVDPLDANGLSAGDRAILSALARLEAGGFMVNIGTIQAPTPVAAAKEVVSAMRAETYRMGVFS